MPPQTLAKRVAWTLSTSPWTEAALRKRLHAAIGVQANGDWVDPFLARFLTQATSLPKLSRNRRELLTYVWSDVDFARQFGSDLSQGYTVELENLAEGQMAPADSAVNWPVPSLTNSRELADWFALSLPHLDWLADRSGLERWANREPLRNYRYRWIRKHTGGRRLVESPKPRLKSVQRQILDGILSAIPVHSAGHAFRRDRSVTSFAAPHVGKTVVLRIDLRDFFPSIRASRIHGIFRTAGYPEIVCQLLTGLCTNRTWRGITDDKLFGVPHLAQGAPTSPSLSNLAAWHLDCRLTGLATKFGAKYTRYADDLVFSGDHRFQKRLSRFRVLVYSIALAEGFRIRNRKTRVMPKSQRQRVAGVVVNERVGVSRREFDRLKAILTNCIRSGPETQNRDSHPRFREYLRGRVAWVNSLNAKQGARLDALFRRIDWSGD